jgi:hypothetical protein
MRCNVKGQASSFLKISLLLAGSSIFSSTAAAHCLSNKFYAGAGLTVNSDQDYSGDAKGFQIFGGYCLDIHKQFPHVLSSIELGYMDSGEFKRDVLVRRGALFYQTTQSKSYQGPWLNWVGEYKLNPRAHLLARVGVDGGDNDGLMGGLGIGLNFSKWAQFRVEYVARQNIDSTQISWLTEF